MGEQAYCMLTSGLWEKALSSKPGLPVIQQTFLSLGFLICKLCGVRVPALRVRMR